MSILVFGKTGQVAGELQRQADVIALSRAEADLSDPAACAGLITTMCPEIVINAAAFTGVDQAEDQEALATVINGEAPVAMARAAADIGVPFVHISTDYVFDGTGENPWSPGDPTAPLGAYGRSKRAGELGVLQAGGRAVILRTSWVFSAFGQNFVKSMLRLAKDRDTLNVVSDQIGGPTPAAAIAAACLRIARQLENDDAVNGIPGGIYHFSGAPNVSWADFARAIFRQANLDVRVKDIPTSAYPTPAARPANSTLDCTSLRTDFGIERPDWQAGLVDVLNDL